MFIYGGAALVAVLIAILAVMAFGPGGTPTGAPLTPDTVCEGLTGAERERCLMGAGNVPASDVPGARETQASSNSGRNTRGSGIEGVTSGGITTDPPSR